MHRVANRVEEAILRFLVGTGLRIDEAAVVEWWTSTGKRGPSRSGSSPSSRSNPKTMEERTIAVSETLFACLRKYRCEAPDDVLIFPSPVSRTVDKHLDRIINQLINKVNRVGHRVRKPKKPCHAFRVLYATRRHQHGVDIETLRQELGHSDISTTQIYLRSVDFLPPSICRKAYRICSSLCRFPGIPPPSLPPREPQPACRSQLQNCLIFGFWVSC
jgi:integrase